MIDIKVPALPESVSDATVAKWHKQPGDRVEAGVPLVDLETDKVMLEVPAIQSGVLKNIVKPEGSVVSGEEILGHLDENAVATVPEPSPEPQKGPTPAETPLSPSVRRMVAEHAVNPGQIVGTGKGGRIVKSDVMASMHTARREQRVPMSRLRARVAERLLEAQRTTAMLTTFNEVNMQPIMDMRARYRDLFEKTHDTRLGFMSFFIQASVAALKKFPSVNASIDGGDMVYHDYFDIGVAISSPRGLVVPIIRDADQLDMAGIERAIVDYAGQAKTGHLSIESLSGGTFTLTNGGVFGSMLSTPILNPPQSAILGMHAITPRAVVEDNQVVIRPMMYLALSYDHRIIDGSESVRFLVTIKDYLEDPARLLFRI